MVVNPTDAINSTASPHRLYQRDFCTLPSFARIMRPRWRPAELNDRDLRSRVKIEDYEQSIRVQPSFATQTDWQSRTFELN